MSRTVTMDFREEFEAERTHWLRKRFLWYAGVLGSVTALNLVGSLLGTMFVDSPELNWRQAMLFLVNGLPQGVLLWLAFIHVYRKPLRRESLLRLVYILTIVIGTVSVITSPFFTESGIGIGITTETAPEVQVDWSRRMRALASVFVTHFVACLFIPWTWREATRPLVPLLLVFIIVALAIGGGSPIMRIPLVVMSPLVGLPGLAICWWRHSRFRDQFHYRMMRGRYGEMQRELVDARRIHESLFPTPITAGPVRMHYRYEPMRQIGGDFLYANVEPGATFQTPIPRLNIVVLDVTGHGIIAALTVNRLYGELERLYAEEPDIAPGAVLEGLNRYVNLTMSKQSIYATAVCLRVDCAIDRVEWASAGHPPAFLRTAAGHIDRLESTAPLLGVFRAYEFKAQAREVRFGSGDTIIAYTDGAMDGMNHEGDRLRIDGLQKMLVGLTPEPDHQGRWAATLFKEIKRHRFGASADDTLLVELYRPVG